MVVIDGYAGYVPLYRIERDEIANQHRGSASGESAVPGRDENHVTMACEAATGAVRRSEIDGADLGAVCTASITDPFAEHGVAAHVAYRIGATGDVRTADFRGTPRAATDALALASDHVAATGDAALVVGVDVMPVEPGTDDEPYAGAGAGAVVVREGAPSPAATILGVGQETTGFVERHRLHGEPAETGDESFEGEYGFGVTVETASQRALAAAADLPSRAVVTTSDQRMAKGAIEEFPGELTHESTFDSVGYAGTASFYLDLAHLLEGAAAGETGVAAAYGAGGADAVAFETADGTGADGPTVAEQIQRKEYVTYAKHLEYRERVEYEGASAV